MQTKIISNYDKFINKFTRTGRQKNLMYKNLEEFGMREIRERQVSKDQFMLMGSKRAGKCRSDITIGVDLKRGYTQKTTSLSKMLVCFDEKCANLCKIISDWSGNIISQFTKSRTIVNGKTEYVQTVKTIPGKYTKTSENFAGGPVEKTFNMTYQNGNEYNFKQYRNNSRCYSKKIDGTEFCYTYQK